MDVKTSTGGWEKMRTSVGGVIGRGVWGKGVIDSLKDLTKNLENAEEKIKADDSDGVISFHHVDRKTTYQEIYEKMNTLYDFSGVAHGIVEETIDDKFYQEIDKYAETMRDLSIENYSTDNIIGAQQMDSNFSTSYMQTPQMIDKKKVGVDDLFGDNSVLGKRMKSEFEAYLKQNPDKKMDYEDYKGAMLHSRAFDYTSIKDGQMEKEMWWNLGILVVTVAAAIVCPPAGAALFLITDALELGSALSGEDWISGRKLGGGERAFRGGLSLIGLGALGAFSKGAKAVEKVENIGDGVKGLGKYGSSKVKDFSSILNSINKTGTVDTKNNKLKNYISLEMKRHNMTLSDFEYLKLKPMSELTSEEIKILKTIREGIPKINSETMIQKTIPSGDIENYLSGKYNTIGGYVAKADDVSHITKYDDVVESSRLDYTSWDGSRPYPEGGDSYGKINFKTNNPDQITIPYGERFGGNTTDPYPCTLNGFTGSRNGEIVPEWQFQDYYIPKDGAELIEVNNGKETLIAIFDEISGVFVPVLK